MSNSFECPGPVHAQRFRFKIEEAKVREIRVASGCCCGGAIRRSQSLSAIPVVAQLWHRYTHNTRCCANKFSILVLVMVLGRIFVKVGTAAGRWKLVALLLVICHMQPQHVVLLHA